MNKTTPNSLRKFLEQSYGKQLADEEVSEYKDRLVKFFSLLIEIDQQNRRKSNEANNRPVVN